MMSCEIKRWKLFAIYGTLVFGCIFFVLALIGLAFLCFYLSQAPRMSFILWEGAAWIPLIVLVQYWVWQRLLQVHNSVWLVKIDKEGLHMETLHGHERILWQELAKVEKSFDAATAGYLDRRGYWNNCRVSPFVYQLKSSDGRTLYIPWEIDRSGAILEQIKSGAYEAGATPIFILPERSSKCAWRMTAAIFACVPPILFFVWFIPSVTQLVPPKEYQYQYGYIDRTGKLVIPAKFDEAEDFWSKYGAAVKVGNKWGWINKSGQFIIKPKFAEDADAFGDGSSGLVAVRVHGKIGFVNRDGKTVIKPQFDDASGFSNDIADVKIGNQWGCINKKGKFVIKPIFDENVSLHFDDNGRALVIFQHHVACIDRKGNILFKTPYTEIYAPNEGLVPVKLNGKWGLMDERGKTLCEPKYDGIDPLTDNMVGFKLNGKWGLMDCSGKIIFEPKYDWLGTFNDGLASVELNKKLGYINRSGHLVIPMQFGDFSRFFWEGRAAVCPADEPNKWIPDINNMGYIDLKGNYIVKPQYFAADEFSEGLAAVGYRYGKYGFVNKSGEMVIKPCFDYAWRFTDGLAMVVVNDKYGYIDKTGAFVIPPTYDMAYPFYSEGLAKVGFAKVIDKTK